MQGSATLLFTRLQSVTLRSALSTLVANGKTTPLDFTLFPDFLTLAEQKILLATSLRILDSAETRQHQRWRKSQILRNPSLAPDGSPSVQSLFLPDEYYQFEEGHYDGVIHNYREMHVTSWPEADTLGLSPIINRLYSLCPTQAIQTHLLHLASHGEILPHIDNVLASGSWILGASLGAPRIMRMECLEDENDYFDVLLPSGSVYLQRDTVRFRYKHSILRKGTFSGREICGGQRISLMIRDRLA